MGKIQSEVAVKKSSYGGLHNSVPVTYMGKVRMEMRKNNYTSFFKIKPKKVERYIRCRKCGGNMEWSRGFPPQIKCPKCGYTVYPKPYEPDCIKLPETLEEYFELYEKIRRKNG